MIALLEGQIQAVALDRATINVGGVGYWFYATPTTLSKMQSGHTATVHTHLVVREDALTLFGFETAEERDVFATLIGISGIGPKLALATLAVFPPAELRRVIANQEVNLLTKIPGVGKKSAQRILVEIGDKLGPISAAGNRSADAALPRAEVVQALEQLGWKSALATQAVEEASAQQTYDSVPELLRASLQILGKAHA